MEDNVTREADKKQLHKSSLEEKKGELCELHNSNFDLNWAKQMCSWTAIPFGINLDIFSYLSIMR